MSTPILGLLNTQDSLTRVNSSDAIALANAVERTHVQLARVSGAGFYSPTDFSPSDGGSGTINIDPGTTKYAIVGDAGSEKVMYLSTTKNIANPGNGTWYVYLTQTADGSGDVEFSVTSSATPAANTLMCAQVVISGGAYGSGTTEVKTATGRKNLLIGNQEVHIAQATVSTSQILALNATPQTIIPAPGAGFAVVIDWAVFFLDYNAAAYAGIAAGEDLALRYTNGSGTVLATCEATGFLDQTSDQTRFVYPYRAASGASEVTPTANAVVVLHMLTGEVTTGNSPLYVRVAYRILPTTLP